MILWPPLKVLQRILLDGTSIFTCKLLMLANMSRREHLLVGFEGQMSTHKNVLMLA